MKKNNPWFHIPDLLDISISIPQFPANAISRTHVINPPSLMSCPDTNFLSGKKIQLHAILCMLLKCCH